MSVGPSAPLTALNSGTVIGPKGDDLTTGVSLPFPIPFFGFVTTGVVVSTNGVLYIPIPPESAVPNPNFGPFDFAIASETNLRNLAMVAGMWADLRTDRNATDNVYMVQPDLDHVIFRWQAVTFGTETPCNFEIELARDGTIKTRYGSGNADLRPVIVGLSGGDREPYPVASHSSESAPLSLTNAQSVTFALRNPPPPPVADLSVSVTTSADPVISGQTLTYRVRVTNLGPSPADLLVMTHVLPAGTSFIACSTDHFGGTCNNSLGTVTGTINILQPTPSDSGIVFTIVVNVNAAAGASLQSNSSATSVRPDPNPANNSASVISTVVAQAFFSNGRAIAAGNAHTTSVRSDGTVWTWGTGSQGQLGDGSFGIGVRTLTPLLVPGLDGVEAIEDSNGFVLALKANGTVWGWGNNGNAQLGDGTNFFLRTRPVQTAGLTNVSGIAAGGFWGAAVKTDGTVWVWGADGSLTGTFATLHTTPVHLSGVANVTAIAAGANHLLMLKEDKTVWAIGVNAMGQLGNGNTTNSTTPVQVAGLSNVARISAGEEFGLALKADGTIWAWGINFTGQLGPGGGSMDFSPHPNPVQVTGLPGGMTNISAGDTFCLALASDGTIWSWGNNNSFQLGQGSQISQNPTPRQIPNFGNVAAIAAGKHHSAALKTDGSVWCWGASTEGELGDGTSNASTITPVRVSGIETVNSPVINPPGGKFFNSVAVTISCPTPGATIHFTTNGGEPTESDPVIASGGTINVTIDTIVRARAWKPGMIPSGTTLVGFEQTAPLGPPVLFLDESGVATNRLAALDSLMWTRDPFSVVNPSNLLRPSDDSNTRVSIFAANLQLFVGETAASVTINLTDANGTVFNVTAEDVRQVPNGIEVIRVTFRLPNNLAGGTCQVKLVAHNLTSNTGTILINP